MASLWNGSGVIVRTDGTRSGSDLWEQARDASVAITAGGHDTHDEGLADSIELCLNVNGETAMAATLDMGANLIDNLATGTVSDHAARVDQIQKAAVIWGGTSGGSANAQTLTLSPAITAYAAGMTFRFIAGATNTGATTLNVNSVGAANLMGPNGSALSSRTIVSGCMYEVTYDASSQFRLRNVHIFGPIAGTVSGTTIDFTSIPLNCKRITILLDAVSTDGAGNLELQLGDSGGFETASYAMGGIAVVSGTNTTTIGANPSDAIVVGSISGAGSVLYGKIEITLMSTSGNSWIVTHCVARGSTGVASFGAGLKSLSSSLDRIRIQNTDGDTFDAGAIAILYEV